MEELFLLGRLEQLRRNAVPCELEQPEEHANPLDKGQRRRPRPMQVEEVDTGLLDSHLIASDDELRTLPIIRVLTGVLFNELVAWTCTLCATVLLPQFINVETFMSTVCLVLLLLGITTLAVCYAIMVDCARRYRRPAVLAMMVVLHMSIAFICVCSAVLIHELATLCFVLMVWGGTLIMLLKLYHSPGQMYPPRSLLLLTLYSSLFICFVCVAQELTLKDLAVNLVALLLNGLLIAFRYDWLAAHAIASDTTYNLSDVDRAWIDLYTWTTDRRVMAQCCRGDTAGGGTNNKSTGHLELPFANETL
jgi:hypothetical protein